MLLTNIPSSNIDTLVWCVSWNTDSLNRSCRDHSYRPATSSTPIMPGEKGEITGGWGIATSRYLVTLPPSPSFPLPRDGKKGKHGKGKTKQTEVAVLSTAVLVSLLSSHPRDETDNQTEVHTKINRRLAKKAEKKKKKIVRSTLCELTKRKLDPILQTLTYHIKMGRSIKRRSGA